MGRRIELPQVVGGTGVGRLVSSLGGGDTGREKCGVVGVWGSSHGVYDCYQGLWAQQHRGQESAGIAVSDGRRVVGYSGMGLVSEVFTVEVLEELERGLGVRPPEGESGGVRSALARSNGGSGSSREGVWTAGRPGGAIGHNRYSTTGGSRACNAQPLVETYIGGEIAVAHNGNIVNAGPLRRLFGENGHIFHSEGDTEVMIHLLAAPEQRLASDPVAAMLRRLQGAFSVVLLFPDRIEAARDPWGWRPLVLGRLADGAPVVASETVALDVIGATVEREVEPGEIVTLDGSSVGGEVGSRRFAEPAPRLARCVFEHVYFASPASTVFGQNVQVARERMGERLAAEAPCPGADHVMPMPDSGRSAASGYARASGIPYREGIVPNRYVGRTFIKPSQGERDAAVRLKLNVIGEIVRGRRVVIVDDSIVRGTTTRAKMRQLRQAGASEIHLRISCPPIRHPCYFGVDFATRSQLIAHRSTVEQIRDYLEVDSLEYLSLEGMLSVMRDAPEHYCTACFTGDYRIDIEHPTTEAEGGGQLGMFC